MTREEVNAMTDDELRVKAAELMGWTKISNENFYGCPPGWESTLQIPDYIFDMAAAWPLVEKMVEMEWYPELINVGVRGELWCMYLDNVRRSIRDMYAQNENVKRAITISFIAAMELTNAN